LDELAIPAAHLWGYSMGGWIGYRIATATPERVDRLVLGGAHAFADPAKPFHHVDGRDPEVFIKALETFAGATVTEKVKAEILKNDLQALAAAMHDRESQLDLLPTIKVPTLLYCGERDPRHSKIEECSKLIPNAEFLSLPGLNHVDAFISAEMVLPPILRFLTQP
jgi:pimeloyl-ACP methyl ester carboxylesterase